MGDPRYLTPESYSEGMITESRVVVGGDVEHATPVRFDVANPGTLLEEMGLRAQRAQQDFLRREGVRLSCVARDGMSIDDTVAEMRLMRRPPRLQYLETPTPTEARAFVANAERAEKDAASVVASALQSHAAACTERDKLDARARKAEADAEKIRVLMSDESAREEQVVAGGDLHAVEAWSNKVGDLERRGDAARKIATNFRSQADVALQRSQEFTVELQRAQLASTVARASLVAARLEAGAAEIASKVTKQLAPLAAELDRLLVELCTIGEDPGNALFAFERVAGALRLALEGSNER
jgi:hypothetical protein